MSTFNWLGSTSLLIYATQSQIAGWSEWYGSDGYDEITMNTTGNSHITRVCSANGDLIDSITTFFSNNQSSGPYGGNGGSYECMDQLNKHQCITSVNVNAGSNIDALQFTTSDGIPSPKFGGNGGTQYTANAETDYCLTQVGVQKTQIMVYVPAPTESRYDKLPPEQDIITILGKIRFYFSCEPFSKCSTTIAPSSKPIFDPTSEPTLNPITPIPTTASPSVDDSAEKTESDIRTTLELLVISNVKKNTMLTYWIAFVIVTILVVFLCFGYCYALSKRKERNSLNDTDVGVYTSELGMPLITLKETTEEIGNGDEKWLRGWLKDIVGLEDYFDNFWNEGYERYEFVRDIKQDVELKEIGIYDKEHQMHILREIGRLNEGGNDPVYTVSKKMKSQGLYGANESEELYGSVEEEETPFGKTLCGDLKDLGENDHPIDKGFDNDDDKRVNPMVVYSNDDLLKEMDTIE